MAIRPGGFPRPDRLIRDKELDLVLNLPAEYQEYPGWWEEEADRYEELKRRRALAGIDVLDFADYRYMPEKQDPTDPSSGTYLLGSLDELVIEAGCEDLNDLEQLTLEAIEAGATRIKIEESGRRRPSVSVTLGAPGGYVGHAAARFPLTRSMYWDLVGDAEREFNAEIDSGRLPTADIEDYRDSADGQWFDAEFREDRELVFASLATELGIDESRLGEVIGREWYTHRSPLAESSDIDRWVYAGEDALLGLGISAKTVDVVRAVRRFERRALDTWIHHQPVASIRRSKKTFEQELHDALVEASRQIPAEFAVCWSCHRLQHAGATAPGPSFECGQCAWHRAFREKQVF